MNRGHSIAQSSRTLFHKPARTGWAVYQQMSGAKLLRGAGHFVRTPGTYCPEAGGRTHPPSMEGVRPVARTPVSQRGCNSCWVPGLERRRMGNLKSNRVRNERRNTALLGKTGYRCSRSAASLGAWDIVVIGQKDIVSVRSKRATCRAPAKAWKLTRGWRDGQKTTDVKQP